MTENEAIERIRSGICNEIGTQRFCRDSCMYGMDKCAYSMAIHALEEIQQYRAIGTVEECRTAYAKGYNQGTIDRAEEVTKTREHGYTKAIDEFAEQFCAACCENTFHATINGIKNVEMMTLDGITETIFEVAEKMKGGAT